MKKIRDKGKRGAGRSVDELRWDSFLSGREEKTRRM
jgi:hypothetical protein